MYEQYHVIRPNRWCYWVAIMLGIHVLLWSMSSFATCTASDPLSDVTVLYSGQLDSPVRAQLGSSNVTILLDATSRAAFSNVTERTVLQVEDNSRIENNGSISLSGSVGSGGSRGAMMVAVGDGNVLVNQRQGSLLSTGAFNDAMVADGQGNTLLNLGSITTYGPNAFGMSAAWHQGQGQPNNQQINHGDIQTNGSNARGMSILGGNGQMTNSGSVQTTGNSSPGVYMQGNNNSFVNSGFVGASGQDGAVIFANTVEISGGSNIELNQSMRLSLKGGYIQSLSGSEKGSAFFTNVNVVLVW